MRQVKLWLIGLILTIGGPAQIAGDIYLNWLRGSNNRLNGKAATRANANRLFDSQNNNRGGYNVGDKENRPAGSDQEKQYLMNFFQSGENSLDKTFLTMEWTNQHGCGGNEDTSPQKQNCALVLQFMCQDDASSNAGNTDSLRNGGSTSTPSYTKPNKNNVNTDRKSKDVNVATGQHELWDWYNQCYLRERNKGLFVADQKLTSNNGLGYSSAIYTRQNPTGNRYGYECPEERDYYPYWVPNPWLDMAVLAENASMCSYYEERSGNVVPYHQCREPGKAYSKWNNEKDCSNNGGEWSASYNYLEKETQLKNRNQCERKKAPGVTYKWAVPRDSVDGKAECLVLLNKPTCIEAPWSRSNHHGNGRDGVPLNFTWTLPYFPSSETKRCVARIRYNISTDDYDPYNTDYRHNDNFPNKSPIQQNPYVSVLSNSSPLRLAINTAQFGRVFEDRSHVFKLVPRPAEMKRGRIFNLNVRGKRGNIVQVYPAVEYDFVPNRLDVTTKDLIHIQWTGSNTHNNGNNGGDGQTGAAGEGKEGSDRNNFVEMSDRSGNFPTPFEHTKLWNVTEVVWIYHGKTDIQARDLAINLATSGYFRCADSESCPEQSFSNFIVSNTKVPRLSSVLDNAPASYEGVVIRVGRPGVYHYMCTRNNSFSNRSQKGAIVVKKEG